MKEPQHPGFWHGLLVGAILVLVIFLALPAVLWFSQVMIAR